MHFSKFPEKSENAGKYEIVEKHQKTSKFLGKSAEFRKNSLKSRKLEEKY
jgi:hypothetical protein